MTKEEISVTYENNVFYCTKNGTKWISVDGKKWYGEEKRIAELENKIADIKANCDLAIKGRDVKIMELEQQVEKMKCCGNCRFSESDTLNGTFCHRKGCFVVASAKCKLWEM